MYDTECNDWDAIMLAQNMCNVQCAIICVTNWETDKGQKGIKK